MDITITLNRTFTRHDNPDAGSPNPTADPTLVSLLADANDNGATTTGITVDGVKLVGVTGIGQDEVSLTLAHYIASKGLGCDVINADSCRAFVEIFSLDDNPSPHLPGYYNRVDEDGVEYPWTWGAWLEQPHKAATERGGRLFIGASTFADRSVSMTAIENLNTSSNGVTLIHPSDLPPAEEV